MLTDSPRDAPICARREGETAQSSPAGLVTSAARHGADGKKLRSPGAATSAALTMRPAWRVFGSCVVLRSPAAAAAARGRRPPTESSHADMPT